MPIAETINDKKEAVAQLQNQYIKGQQILQQEDKINEAKRALEFRLNEVKNFYISAPSADGVKINLQKKLQQIAQGSEVELVNFEWQSDLMGTPSFSVLNLKLEGAFKNVASFHLELVALGVWLDIQEFYYRINDQNPRRKAQGRVSGDVVIKISYLVDAQ